MTTYTRWTGGPLLLAGSGEYTAAMAATDRLLLRALGRDRPRVALLPTASALEPGMPAQWNRRGVEHFRRLGCEPLPLLLCSRADAADPQIAAAIAECDLIYFSGGQPDYLIETLADTAAFAAVQQVVASGGALAGCSAGAMMMGAVTVSIRGLLQSGQLHWRSAHAVAGGLVVIPHFDRIHQYLPLEQLEQALHALPPHLTAVGIDEFTALVDDGNGWQVSGLHSVTVFAADGPHVYRAGQRPPVALTEGS
jgi:cyanophycinase